MKNKERLRKLAAAQEQVHQALLGCNWEERYALWNLEEKIKQEIIIITTKEDVHA